MNEQELVDLLRAKVYELNVALENLNAKDIYTCLSLQQNESSSDFKSAKRILICEIVKPVRPSKPDYQTPKFP